MKDSPDPSPTLQRHSIRRFLLERAFWILGAFTLLFLVTCLPIPSQHPSPPVLVPAFIAFGLGVTTWVITFLFCVHAFFIPAERPSFIASFSFFLFFGIELFMVAQAIHLL
jgi:anaerobic C4-dicarboxylate transporter